MSVDSTSPPPAPRSPSPEPTLLSPNRFITAPLTLFIDRTMTWVIKAGGLGIIVAVFGIFAFILVQILPLFQGAQVSEATRVALPIPAAQIAGLALDEWGQVPTVIARNGQIYFVGVDGNQTHIVEPTVGTRQISVIQFDDRASRLLIGCNDGSFIVTQLSWTMNFEKNKDGQSGKEHTSTITGSTSRVIDLSLTTDKALLSVGYAAAERSALAVAIVDAGNGKRQVLAIPIESTGGLIGGKRLVAGEAQDLSALVHGIPERILVDERGEGIVIITQEGELFYCTHDDAGIFTLAQKPLAPFADTPNRRIASCNWLLGDVSLILTNPDGMNRELSLFHPPGEHHRQFNLTKEFPLLPSGASAYAVSTRNKCFLLSAGHTLSLRHGTSANERYSNKTTYTPVAVALSGKYNRIAVAGDDERLHVMNLSDPHPEAGLRALFGSVWYEGKPAPTWDWQSTGGSDDFEPKLSLVPLMWGTLKATFYAMIVAVPLALLGAIYTAEFMHPRFKKIVKPMVEIMASLPSVVLGFLAALWLAPLLEQRVPSLLAVFIALPTIAILIGWWWSGLSMRWRSKIKPGYEYLAFIPLLALTTIVAWSLGPWLEDILFAVPNSDGVMAGDFRTWWTATTGLGFEQRNSLVVGLIMGFAVIPIIFTISEDALSNVPATLRSGSLALGASRWQTAMRVIVPTASAGIFSALMIGLGRAIGETMIVVMATGNTPIMSGNIFDGLRSLSANIAVELPEAAQHSTLYRTLFLGAFLLFILTFIVNTAAELLRQHLREKYKTV